MRSARCRTILAAVFAALPFAFSLTACGDDAAGAGTLKSNLPRAAVTEASRADAKTLADANAAFAWDLFHVLAAGDGNLFFSPFSVSEALAMVYAGARGETAAELEQAFHFDTLRDRTHSAFNALDQALLAKDADVDSFRLAVANATWGQRDYRFEQAYLDLLAANYGSGLHLADFKADPEAARQVVNDWVADQTEQRIKDLMPQGSVTRDTRLVLTNAIYFHADWERKFAKALTAKGAFKLLDGRTVEADLMRQTGSFAYARAGNVEALELPYVGKRVSLLILLPAAGEFASLQASLDAKRVADLVGGLKATQMSLAVPKFSFTSTLPLKDSLQTLGIRAVFEPGRADLSGMNGQRELFVTGVYHKAFVKVDEEGTEAAAATGVGVGATSAPALSVSVDRPFIFLIRDRESGAVLFAGRVLDPTK